MAVAVAGVHDPTDANRLRRKLAHASIKGSSHVSRPEGNPQLQKIQW